MPSLWNVNGTASVAVGETTVTTTANFRDEKINVGAGIAFGRETDYEIVSLDEPNRQFELAEPYAGEADQVDSEFKIKHFLGVARDLENTLIAAAGTFETALSADPLDNTLGRVLRVGDFGHNGASVLLDSSTDLNNVNVEGVYSISGSSFPLNMPATAVGSHTMTVTRGIGTMFTQELTRATAAGSSMKRFYRVCFTESQSPWFIFKGTENIISAITYSGSNPTDEPSGGVYEPTNGTESDYTWRCVRNVAGEQRLRVEVDVDVTTTSSQVFDYPDGLNFVSGGFVCASVSYAHTTPNDALRGDNLVVAANNSNFVVRLQTAGATGGSSANQLKLRLAFFGDWREVEL